MIEGFDAFWGIYPKQRAGSRKRAFRAYADVIKEGRATQEHLMQATATYAISDDVLVRHKAKGCAWWLRDDQFNSEYKSQELDNINAARMAARMEEEARQRALDQQEAERIKTEQEHAYFVARNRYVMDLGYQGIVDMADQMGPVGYDQVIKDFEDWYYGRQA